ncbi:hypothetical protein KAFR_0A01610 [Kazachstania africana CBS 2517]|uniref:Structural maintenance of chromosomes protein n=1 Tax=Kazachstania africana (strain ATCC 22294 / BCRC 22015 / CBS 2517 / CECT 1963 / NBRC 1671 / NRRL Y-8276) TaxID=1071382 RepID=H2AMJ9_KAZAF|nr:hypothetical protein KAFR_0A01610 [Kazachstania africana CBS 2517]CCF55599.1 hypothetical protein KAFR_0A01610 [Kazachstania africana CBS 2517]
MYIKRVIIKGFKTYRNETIIDNFSPHHNIIIGSNGSGKSNLFAAIRFVLSDDYSNLKREERQGLIHQGTSGGSSVMSCSVEIVFHDPDNRMILASNASIVPRPNNEVFIRRTVGLKKDDYQINDRNVTKSDIVRILETAGFSMSNPYNIVPQGKIIALTNAKDKERLQLLEDVVGAKSFEIKLNDSLKKIKETEFKKSTIDKELSELKNKLNEMEWEKLELEKFNKFDKNRKVLQFTLYDRELNDLINQIESLDDDYNSILQSSESYIQELDKRETMVNDVTMNLNTIGNHLKIKINNDLQQAKSNLAEVLNKSADINLKINDLQNQLSLNTEQSTSLMDNLGKIKNRISERQEKLNKILPRFNELTNQELKFKFDLEQLKQKQRDLLLKRSSYERFESKQERDNWINSEIKEQESNLNDLQNHSLNNLSIEYANIKASLNDMDVEINSLNESIAGNEITSNMEGLTTQYNERKRLYSEKIDQRKELWRREQKLQAILDTVSNDLKQSERNLNETMDRNLSHGIASIKEITQKLKLPPDSVFGTVGELIKASEKYKNCVEIIGGNQLFHIIVDTEETASLLMQELYRMKGGRVTFIPLNKIYNDPNITYPPADQYSSFTPLIKKLKYESKFEGAMKHIFGKTIVVKDLSYGLKLAKKFKLNAITLDGDRADKRGVLTGGYFDYHKRTRLESLKNLSDARDSHAQTTADLETVKRELAIIDSEIDKLNGELRTISNQRETILTNVEHQRVKLNNKKSEKYVLEESLQSVVLKREKVETNISIIREKVISYQHDLETDFESALSSEQKQLLETISASISKISNDLTVTSEALESITTTINTLNAELNSKLIPQQQDIESKISEIGGGSIAQDLVEELRSLESQRERLDSEQEEAKNDIYTIQNEIDGLNGEKTNNEKILEKANSQQRLLLKKIENYQKSVEKTLIKKTTLASRRDELQQKIREIGLLAEDALNDFNSLSSEDLLEKLNEANSEISKLVNVNKRAFENFRRFGEKQTELVERSRELELSKISIQELIEKLKEQKINAVDKTFRKVSENFVKVFETLVPRGTGKLVIHRTNQENSATPDLEDETNDMDIDAQPMYTGVSISVSFNSKNDEQLHVEQLSGGQKTVCAIALILAIQMVDPAPFYLFDEIDAALDKQYRTAVANTLKELSKNAQFICTTFRTDMLQVADKFFRVKYENKISSVLEIERDEAINFIRGSSRFADV